MLPALSRYLQTKIAAQFSALRSYCTPNCQAQVWASANKDIPDISQAPDVLSQNVYYLGVAFMASTWA